MKSPKLTIAHCNPKNAGLEWESMGDNGSPITSFDIKRI